MGLLSDPKKRQSLLRIISRYNTAVSVLLYGAGLVGLIALAHQDVNNRCYISENALLPGLVKNEFENDDDLSRFEKELMSEMNKDKNEVPREWIMKKFKDMGLDTYLQNFSLRYPFLRGPNQQHFASQNIFAILRARRAASTEALVMSAPLRPQGAEGQSDGGIVVMLALAHYFRRQTYWAKDIIFLLNGFDYIGTQAWLDAYHDTSSEYIFADDLPGRSGQIQAAINLEIPAGSKLKNLDIKMHGLNGQLPNLDLFNLVLHLCQKNSLSCTLHNRDDHPRADTLSGFQHTLGTMLQMMWTQASGSPSASHGLFHRFHIEALTIEGIPALGKDRYSNIELFDVARIGESIFRSLNNLLERFHQSFFFYLLPSTHRYISIGLYMIPFSLVVASGLIKAVALWIGTEITEKGEDKQKVEKTEKPLGEEDDGKTTRRFNKNDNKTVGVGSNKKENSDGKGDEGTIKEGAECTASADALGDESDEDDNKEHLGSGILNLIPVMSVSLLLGFLAYIGPDMLAYSTPAFHLRHEDTITFGLLALFCAGLFYPYMITRKTSQEGQLSVDWKLLKCVALLVHCLVLSAVALMNISLAFFLSLSTLPVVTFVQPTNSRSLRWLQIFFLLLVSPAGLAYLSALVTVVMQPDPAVRSIADLLLYAWSSMKQSVLLRILDKYFFGCWTYSVLAAAIFPTWLLFWSIPYSIVP